MKKILEKIKAMSRVQLTILFMVALLIIAVSTSVYFYVKFTKAVKDPNSQAKEEAIKDLEKTKNLVEKHMILPSDEEPTLATVSDPSKLIDQPFFKNAEKGDKVLLYSRSKKAILYSVSKDKILEVAPFSGAGSTIDQ